MKRIIITLIICLGLKNLYAQEDPLYRLYQFNKLMINPAYAGAYNKLSASFLTSAQWVGIEGAPITNLATVQSTIKDGEIGLGAIVSNDLIGISSTNEIQLASSYNIRFDESSLAFGLQGGIINQNYDLSRLDLEIIDDPILASGLNSTFSPNLGLGIMLIHSQYYIGASVPRILDITVDDGVSQSTRYHRHYYLNTGYYFQLQNLTEIKIDALVKMIDGERLPSLDLTTSVNIDGLTWLGLSMRDFTHYGIFFFLEFSKKIKLGYAFELPFNGLIGQNYGTHQIGITFDQPYFNDYSKSGRSIRF